MFSISSFNDIIEINRDLASLFCSPDDAVNVITALNGICYDWVNNRNKQYWEVVRFVCERRGLLGKKTKSKQNKLTRKDFAEILLTFCDKLWEKGETPNALKSSMDKYQFCTELSRFETLPDAHLARKDVQDVEDLFDQKPVEMSPIVVSSTLEDRVYQYLRLLEDRQSPNYPRIVVRQRPNYKEIQPAISVERFLSEKFHHENTPSHIDTYEFVDGVLSKTQLNELIGKYCSCNRNIVKLFIVSTKGIMPDVKTKMMSQNIGYVRLNPRHPMTSDAYELPRKMKDNAQWLQNDDRLMSRNEMDIPLLIMDGNRRETSFSYLYESCGVGWNKSQLINVPFLQMDEIEEKAKMFTETYEANLRNTNFIKGHLRAVNPFEIADELGLTYEITPMQDELLGKLDVRTGHITLNSNYERKITRLRFTMAHEIGHYILHANFFKENNITSLDETENTLKGCCWMSSGSIKRAEHQANLFASYLLMPTITTAALYAYIDESFTGCKAAPMYYNPLQVETWTRYNLVVGYIAGKFQVSREMATYRLMDMKLIKSD